MANIVNPSVAMIVTLHLAIYCNRLHARFDLSGIDYTAFRPLASILQKKTNRAYRVCLGSSTAYAREDVSLSTPILPMGLIIKCSVMTRYPSTAHSRLWLLDTRSSRETLCYKVRGQL